MAARVSRVCDGYPIFLAARSPSRADWIEVLRKTKNWLGLEATWEQLCTPGLDSDRRKRDDALRKDSHVNGNKLNGKAAVQSNDDHGKLDRVKRDAIRDALADERVIDEDTFRQSVRAREAKAIAAEDEEMRKEYHNISPTRTNTKSSNGTSTTNGPSSSNKVNGASSKFSQNRTNLKEKDYSTSTERAELIARWIREAPPPGGDGGNTGSSRKKAGTKKSSQIRALRKQASDMSAVSASSNASGGSNATTGLEQSVESLNMID